MTRERVPENVALVGHTPDASRLLNIVLERGVGVPREHVTVAGSVSDTLQAVSGWGGESGVVVSEMFYPGGGGAYELLEELKKMPGGENVRVVVLTTHEGDIAIDQIRNSYPDVPIINEPVDDMETLMGALAGKENL